MRVNCIKISFAIQHGKRFTAISGNNQTLVRFHLRSDKSERCYFVFVLFTHFGDILVRCMMKYIKFVSSRDFPIKYFSEF